MATAEKTTTEKVTTEKAPVKKVAAKKVAVEKVAAEKVAAEKVAPKKAAAKKSPEFSLKASAEKAVNIYLGVIGKGYDRVQENLKTSRKENKKRMSDLEKRGAKLRKVLNKNFDKLETPELDNVVEDVKNQASKLQDQLENVVEAAKEKLTPAQKAA